MVLRLGFLGVIGMMAFFVATFIPLSAYAAGGAANAMCICQMNPKVSSPPFCPIVPCKDLTSTFNTSGFCASPGICAAVSTDGQNGSGMGVGDLSSLMQAISQLMQAMQGGGGGGGGGGGDTGANGGCTQTYTVTAPSSDPCAIYQPPTSGSIDLSGGSSTAGNDLLNSLLGGSSGTGNTSATQPTTKATTTATSTPAKPTATIIMQPVGIVPGLSGDIRVTTNGATVYVTNQNGQSNTVVAGFYGANTISQPQGLVATWCQTRPWASNFLSKVVPSSFFDGLCTLRGFQIGRPAPATTHATTIPVRPKPRPPFATTTPVASTSTRPFVQPQVDIWAVPASVRLGARTTIFWSTKGVDNCTETSPDGSFTQNSLSGGAATVPLSGITTFTISCMTPDGGHVTNYVTVNLSI